MIYLLILVFMAASFFITWKVHDLTKNKSRTIQVLLTLFAFVFSFGALMAIGGFIVLSQMEFSR